MEKIRIQLDKVVINKTARFIKPCLKLYGNEFIKRVSKIFKLAYGLKDLSLDNNYNNHIFILINADRCKNHFIETLEWIREQEYYETDYSYDNLVEGKLHMLVLKLPEVIDFENFYQGKYSKMYTNGEILELLDESTKAIVTKDESYKVEFVKKLQAQFNNKFSIFELHPEAELELPPNIKQVKIDINEESEFF